MDIPNRQARNKVIDLTRNSNRAFQDVSVVFRTRFSPLSDHLLDKKGHVIEVSDPCAQDWGLTRSDLITRESLLGSFGEMADEAISSLTKCGLFDAGIIAVNCQTFFEREAHHEIETHGISLWIYPVFMNDGEILANCSHMRIPSSEVNDAGSFKPLHIDQVCI